MPKIETNREIVTRAMTAMHGRPSLIAPHYDTFAVDLMAHYDGSAGAINMAEAEQEHLTHMADRYGGRRLASEGAMKPFAFANGIAIIPIHGMLLNRMAYGSSWATGYSFIRRMVYQAEADPDVIGVVFDHNSVGGEAAGMFELAEEIAQMTKPTAAIVDSMSYSASYGLASATDTLYLSPSAGVGSIGVRVMHMDFSKMLDSIGIKVELLHSGKHKIDGNPYNPLPEEVRKQLQSDIDQMRQEFASMVAAGRSLSLQTVLDTEGQSYRSQDAVSLKLADHVLSPAKAFSHFLEHINGASNMGTQDQQQAVTTPAAPAATATQPGTAPAAPTTTNADAAAAERDRISGIMNCEAAKDRPSLAKHLAFSAGMSVEQASGILAASPVEGAKADTTNPLEAAMDNAAQPNVGATAPDGDAGGDNDDASAILAAFGAASGETFGAKK